MIGSEPGLVTVMYSSPKGFTGGFAAFHIALVGGVLNMGMFLRAGSMFVVGLLGLGAALTYSRVMASLRVLTGHSRNLVAVSPVSPYSETEGRATNTLGLRRLALYLAVVRFLHTGRWRWSVIVSCLALSCGLIAITGCRRSERKAVDENETDGKTIGVTLLTVQHQFYQDLRAGLEEEAARHRYKLLVSTAEFDSARQANQIDDFIVQDVDALVVCPCDSRSVGSGIVAANEAGIPVFTADIASTASIGKVTSHIASDNVQGGREAARLLAQAIGGSGQVVILSHPEVASVTDRVKGFKDEIAKHQDIQIVAELSAEGRRDKAVRVMEDLLQSHPDLVGVFGINDDSALGALAAVEAAGKLGQISIVGYDATPEARSKIESGAIYGDVIQHPRHIGRLTIQAIHDHFAGKDPPPVIPVEVGTFTGAPD